MDHHSPFLWLKCWWWKKTKHTQHSYTLGHRHHFSYIAIYRAQFLSANPSLNTDISCMSNQPCWKNTILFIHSASFTWPEFLHAVLQWGVYEEKKHAANKVELRQWGSRGTAVNSPSDPSLNCCQHHLQIMIFRLFFWFKKRKEKKRAFGSFLVKKYCSDIAALFLKKKLQESYLKWTSVQHLIFFAFTFK